MALNLNTSVVLVGIGQGMLIATTGEMFEITKGQNLSLQITATDEKVYGGDSLYPFFTFLKEKGGKISIDDATFNVNQLKVTQNATLNNTTAKKYTRDELTVASGTASQLTATSGVDITSVVCYNKTTGAPVIRVASAPATGQFMVTAAGVITFASTQTAQTFVFSYYVTDATATASAIVMTNAIPGFSELRWKLTTQDEAGNLYDINLRAKKVKTSGTFNLDFGRGKASVQKLEFEVYEPADGSKEFIEVSITDL
jgi:hypothetical protein